MSAVVAYADVEKLVKTWALQSDVAPLLLRGDGGCSIFLAMPAAAPVPALICSLVGGGPLARSDLPAAQHRISFDCWGASREQAGLIARTLIAELETLSRTGGWSDGTALMVPASILNMLWLPDPDSDTPRYIVDALITTVT